MIELILAVTLCTGKVTDKNPRAIIPLLKPPIGQTVTDPAFGTKITRISAPKMTGENAIVKPLYSTMQAWNATETKVIVWHRGYGYAIHNGKAPYAFDHVALLDSPTDIEQVFWDPINPDILYYPSNKNALPRIMKYNVATRVNSLHADMTQYCPSGDWGKLLGLGSDPSGPSFMVPSLKFIGMRCGSTLLIVNLDNGKAVVKTGATGPNLAVALAPYGQVGQVNGYAIDFFLNLLRHIALPNPWEHGSVGASFKAVNVWNSVQFDSNPASLLSTNLDTGISKVIIGVANGWPYPPSGTHISSVTRNIGWVAISSVGNPNFNEALNQEIYLGNVDTGEVCRVGHHRSWAGEGKWGYWAEPHLVLSPSGTKILFGSDWGNGDSVDTYVLDLN